MHSHQGVKCGYTPNLHHTYLGWAALEKYRVKCEWNTEDHRNMCFSFIIIFYIQVQHSTVKSEENDKQKFSVSTNGNSHCITQYDLIIQHEWIQWNWSVLFYNTLTIGCLQTGLCESLNYS